MPCFGVILNGIVPEITCIVCVCVSVLFKFRLQGMGWCIVEEKSIKYIERLFVSWNTRDI